MFLRQKEEEDCRDREQPPRHKRHLPPLSIRQSRYWLCVYFAVCILASSKQLLRKGTPGTRIPTTTKGKEGGGKQQPRHARNTKALACYVGDRQPDPTFQRKNLKCMATQ